MSETKDVLKVRLGNDTRRLVLYNTHISYDDLVLMLQRVFEGKLRPTDDVTLKYFDEDNDLITIADATDFAHAREYSKNKVVKMVIYVNGQDSKTLLDPSQVSTLRKELGDVRDKVNALVDILDTGALNLGMVDSGPTFNKPEEDHHRSEPQKLISTEAVSMFDPLKPVDTITTTASSNIPIVTTSSSTQFSNDSTSTTAHLFQGQTGTQFLEHTQTQNLTPNDQFQNPPSTGQMNPPPNAPPITTTNAPPTAPPPSSSPKPPSHQTYSGYPSSQTGQTGQTGYTGGYQQPPYNQPSAPVPQPTTAPTGPYQQYPPSSNPNPAPYPPTSYPQTGPGTSYNQPGFGQPSQVRPQGPNYSYGPQGQPPAGRGGYNYPNRPSPYRVGY